ncbi:MAG: trigger factor [Burkholderiaceae bacterium]|jgi:trigger factor|nr:trigger factor [Burkholderiaceae bacterium]
MAVNVETLDKLERKMTLNLPVEVIRGEVDARLRKLARTVRMDGFRPGKVPLAVVQQRYGYSVHFEVMNDKVGQAFYDAANEAQLRVAGQPAITEKEGAPEGQLAFDAVFEVFPQVKIGDLSQAEVERVCAGVTDEAIDRTLEILRKQRRSFAQRAQGSTAGKGDRVTVDFIGTIEGEPFDGGKADDFFFVIGEGQMLPAFEDAVSGMKVGESKTFPLAFPADYPGQEVAGKSADFMVTLRKLEAGHLPQIDDAFVKSLGLSDPGVPALRESVRKNLEREIKFRLSALNRKAVMNALLTKAELDLPKASVQAELQRLIEAAIAELKARGIKNADKTSVPEDAFRPQAEYRVRLGLVVAELVKAHALAAKPEQVMAYVQELAAGYEKPQDVVRYYYADPQRLANMETVVMENNVIEYVYGQARVTEKKLGFDELMGGPDAQAPNAQV